MAWALSTITLKMVQKAKIIQRRIVSTPKKLLSWLDYLLFAGQNQERLEPFFFLLDPPEERGSSALGGAPFSGPPADLVRLLELDGK